MLLQQCSPGVVASGILGDAAKVSLLGAGGAVDMSSLALVSSFKQSPISVFSLVVLQNRVSSCLFFVTFSPFFGGAAKSCLFLSFFNLFFFFFLCNILMCISQGCTCMQKQATCLSFRIQLAEAAK